MDKVTLTPPNRFLQLREISMGLDLAHYVVSSALPFSPHWVPGRAWRALRRAPAKRAALLLPGFGGDSSSLYILKQTAADAGLRPVDWGLGRNRGNVAKYMPLVERRLRELVEETGEKVTLIGWSLGGFISREVARDNPDLVDQVITMGTPVIGGPKYTAVAAFYLRQGVNMDEVEATIKARYDNPLTVPVKAIYSKRDGVVSWQACIDHWSPDVEHIHVRQAHLGLGFSPVVQRIVSRLLKPTSRKNATSFRVRLDHTPASA